MENKAQQSAVEHLKELIACQDSLMNIALKEIEMLLDRNAYYKRRIKRIKKFNIALGLIWVATVIVFSAIEYFLP